MSASGLRVETFTSSGWGQNAYLVRCGGGPAAVAIDPGGEAAAMADALQAAGMELEAILLTHAHLDHVEGVAQLKRRTGAPVWLHPADAELYRHAPDQAAMFGVSIETPPPVEHALEPGVDFRFGDCRLEVRASPGHAPGHVIFYAPEAGVAFVGDVVFQGSIGRSDLPGGDFQRLMRSIREQVLTLPDETTLYCGHGPATTVGRERRTNPFLVPDFGGGLA